MKKFIFLILTIRAFAITELIEQLPVEDKASLERFFQLLIREHLFGFCLFGSKPMSMADFAFPTNHIHFISQRVVFEKGWEVWEKHQSLFLSHHYVLKRVDSPKVKTTHFIIINKKKSLEVISQYFEEFKTAFPKVNSPQEILQLICDTQLNIQELLGDSHLVGLLLGFGYGNAYNFKKEEILRNEICQQLIPPFKKDKEFNELNPLAMQFIKMGPLSDFSKQIKMAPNLIGEFNGLLSRREEFQLKNCDYFLDFIQSPSFVCWDEFPETEQLKKKYKIEKKMLSDIYRSAPFLETTLKQWMAIE